MANFIQRLFYKITKQAPFPKISFGVRLEDINYYTEHYYLNIQSTCIDGRRLFTDSIEKWDDETLITTEEKEEIFEQVISFIHKRRKTKAIIVINVDYEKEFWENLFNKYKDQLKEIEYDSNEKKDNFQYSIFLKAVQNNGTLMFGDKTIKTEAELIAYWASRKRRAFIPSP